MLRLTQINVYPVKSLDGFSPSSATVEEKGLQHDRRWMLIDDNGTFMSQRTTRKMTYLRATIEDNYLVISEKQNAMNSCRVLIAQEGASVQVTVWDDTMQAALVSSEMNIFLSNFLGKPSRLVKMPEQTRRDIEADYNTGNDVVSFADGFPFLIIGEASINDLNERLTNPINEKGQPLEGMRRFRTNFVFDGGVPYEEDAWRDFRIGEVDFIGCKPCGRCVMTTLNPDTGVRDADTLETLSKYRTVGKSIKFGQNVLWNKAIWTQNEVATVSVGDLIVR